MPNSYTSSERRGIGCKKWRELFLLMLEGLRGMRNASSLFGVLGVWEGRVGLHI